MLLTDTKKRERISKKEQLQIMNETTAAGIILFNPDISRMQENINAVINQVEHVILVDNGSENKAAIEQALPDSDRLHIIYSQKNKGIAWALNRIFMAAAEYGVSWILTLDQDSVCPAGMISAYQKYLTARYKADSAAGRDTHIGILCPTIVDKHTGVIDGGTAENIPVSRCITSGSLTSHAGWQAIGGFDEKMFIDGVDFDFCDRLRASGYEIIRVGEVRLMHELGRMTTHRFLWRTVKVQNHSAKRKYYIVRNRFYLARKQKKPLAVFKSFFFVIKFSATIILYEKDKRHKIHAVLKGIRDGLRMKL